MCFVDFFFVQLIDLIINGCYVFNNVFYDSMYIVWFNCVYLIMGFYVFFDYLDIVKNIKLLIMKDFIGVLIVCCKIVDW